MNHDEGTSDMQTWIEPELEARVVAWVSGEASAFEIADLERLTREKPELAVFRRRIEAVRGLVAEAVRPEQAPLRLSQDRRATLLASLGGGGPESGQPTGAPKPAVFPAPQKRRRWRGYPAWLLTLAACVCFGLFVWVVFPPMIQSRAKRSAREVLASEMLGVVDRGVADAGLTQRRASEEVSRTKREAEAKAKFDANLRFRAEADAANRLQKGQKTFSVPSAALAAPKGTERQSYSYFTPAGAPAPSSPAVASLGADKLALKDSIGETEIQGGRARTLRESSVIASEGGANVMSYGARRAGTGAFQDGRENLAAPLVAKEISSGYITAPGQTEMPTAGGIQDSSSVDYYNVPRGTANAEARKQNVWASTRQLAADAPNSDSDLLANGPARNSASFDVNSAGAQQVQQPDATGQLPSTQVAEAVELSQFTVQSAAGQEPVAAAKDQSDLKVQHQTPPMVSRDEISAAKEPVSTFSLHVSDVSFRLAQAALARGELPDPVGIRPEEFYNAFSYGDPAPTMAERISCHIEQSAHPTLQQRNLVRLAMKVPATGRGAQQPLQLTVLLDTSGSMEREDRAASVRSAMSVLVSLLGPNDRLTLIGFARQPRLLAEQVPGDQAAGVLDAISRTPAEGGTNLEEALRLGGELAERDFQEGAQNRIVLLTDGAANLGNADPAALAARVETLRQQGIAFDACGVGLDGIDDAMLENLTRKGDGRYYVLDTPEAADAGFARQLAGAFRPAAENVKVQVRFNPARVGRYQLIGFEQHRLNEEDFRNDQVDAAELAAEEAAVALYQVEVLPQGEGELGEVYVRFRDAATGNMVERSWTLSYDPNVRPFDRASSSMQLAGAAALLAENLQGGPAGAAVRLEELAPVMNSLRAHYAHESRVQDLATMYQQLRRIRGE
ncbi:hypothetical protein DB347_23745 [Opitutaceae bacterium EW11]|nr:hypothetical protein DB347_23745 [Opitutaceae bacterium EW11]